MEAQNLVRRRIACAAHFGLLYRSSRVTIAPILRVDNTHSSGRNERSKFEARVSSESYFLETRPAAAGAAFDGRRRTGPQDLVNIPTASDFSWHATRQCIRRHALRPSPALRIFGMTMLVASTNCHKGVNKGAPLFARRARLL